MNIGSFYRDITTDITEASDKGKYKPFFDNIRELLDTVAADENESEIVRLELLELSPAVRSSSMPPSLRATASVRRI